jgi:small subunit ribosomal protein S6
MRGYEALVIFKAAGTEQDIARHAARLEGPIKKVGGSIEVNQSMGRRKLAFRIARHTEGHYYLLRFQAPTEQIGELERLFRLNESVVRFMILSRDETTQPALPQSGSRSASSTAHPTAPSAPPQGGPQHPAAAPTRS